MANVSMTQTASFGGFTVPAFNWPASIRAIRGWLAGAGVIPLGAATLACAIVGPLLHAPDSAAMGAITAAAIVAAVAGFAFAPICGTMLFQLVRPRSRRCKS